MCHGFMALSMRKTRELCKNLGIFVGYDVFLWWLCRKTDFGEKAKKKDENLPRKSWGLVSVVYDPQIRPTTREWHSWVGSVDVPKV